MAVQFQLVNILTTLARNIPSIRGSYHFYKRIARLTKYEAHQIVRMRLGHRLIVDPTSLTEIMAYFEGWYDDSNITLLRYLLRPNEITLDVGGNVGFYAIPLAITARSIGGSVISFEPVPANYRRICENMELNNLSPTLVVHSFGLSSKAGSARITLREHDGRIDRTGNAAIFIEGYDDHFPSFEIDLRPLDALEFGTIGLIKLDIEGHEDEFFKGAKQILQRDRPIIFMEVNRDYYRRKAVDFDGVISTCLPSGYKFFSLQVDRLLGVGSRRISRLLQIDDLLGCDGEDVLIVPNERVDQLKTVPFPL